MKHLKIFNLILFFSLFSLGAYAKVPYTFSQLALRDLDEMNKMIEDRKKESLKDKITMPLREAMVIILSRPDEDTMVYKIMPVLQTELEKYDLFEATFENVVDEAIKTLKEMKSSPPKSDLPQLATYVVILENSLSELRAKKDEEFNKRVLAKIRDAKLDIPKSVMDQLRMGPMKSVENPSEIAKKILEPKKK